MGVRLATKVNARAQALIVCSSRSLPASVRTELNRQWDRSRLAAFPSLGRIKHPYLVGLRTEKHKKNAALDWDDRWAVARAFGSIARRLLAERLKSACIVLPDSVPDSSAEAIVTGLTRGLYRFEAYKSKKSSAEPTITVVSPSTTWTAAAKRALVVSDAIGLARDLVNTPAADMGPDELERAARDVGKATGLTVRVLDAARCAKLGMGALTAVGRASVRPPRLVVLEHKGAPKSKDVLALAGKGIVFDTGGLNLKLGNNMLLMKKDMGGAATVLATAAAIGQLAPPVNVRFYLAIAENAVDGNAMRPGDILTAMDGTTIEIGNTDAEGRLVLADTLAYAVEQGATQIVDVATLTGAAMVALGRTRVPLVGTNDALVRAIEDASSAAGERVWQLPSDREYRDQLNSSIADISNIANGGAGTITGGLFIGHFAKNVPWAHLDISPAAWSPKAGPLGPVGGTGTMVSTLIHLVESRAQD